MSQPRIWDPFLTPRDREHLSLVPRQPVGFGTVPALVLVDNYRGVIGDRPLPLMEAVLEWPAAIGLEAWEALARQREVLGVCRQLEVPVIHVTGTGPTPLPGWNESIHAGSRRGQLDLGSRRPDFHDLVGEVAPTADEVVIAKSAPSAFSGTPLTGLLTYLGVDTLLIGGEATSGCVRATVVDAASLRLRTIVMEDCVYDRHEAAHAINLFDMHQKYADVVPSEEVITWLRGRN